jgi:SAM-dependent methyltransferase
VTRPGDVTRLALIGLADVDHLRLVAAREQLRHLLGVDLDRLLLLRSAHCGLEPSWLGLFNLRYAPAVSRVPAESLQERAERLAERMFLGGPVHDFERVGRMCFDVLLREGLAADSRVLDVGCGALRLGYWLMRFLEQGCYHGIEPNREMLQLGLEEVLEADIVERAQASFAHNDDFDFSSFGERFDFVVARSIWTHTSREQIQTMLASFAAASTPRGVFLTSYHPAGKWLEAMRRWPRIERGLEGLPLQRISPLLAGLPLMAPSGGYQGQGWVGRSHESDERGVVRHSMPWISAQAARHGLQVAVMPYPIRNHQYWLRISHR